MTSALKAYYLLISVSFDTSARVSFCAGCGTVPQNPGRMATLSRRPILLRFRRNYLLP